MWSNQYLKERMWELNKAKRKEIGNEYCEANKKREVWLKDFYANRKFFIKYSNIRYEKESLRAKRNQAYAKRYNAGKNLFVEYNVNISKQHFMDGIISIGNDVLLAKNVFIDYSGELILHDHVALANGVIIETHTHVLEKDHMAPIPSRLEIGDNVRVLTRSYIADTCHFIGRGARIGAGSYIRSNIPPYAIVIGNPAKIIGFTYSPKEMVEYEKNIYSEEDRTSLEKYTQYYEKYFRGRSKEIKSFIKL